MAAFMAARIKARELAPLCRRIGSSLRAGLDVRRIFRTETEKGNGTHRQRMETVQQGLDGGQSIAESLRQCDPYFPSLMCELVDVGERSGKSDEVFLRLAEHYEFGIQLRRGFLVSISWPLIQFVLALVVIGLLIWFLGMIGDNSGEPIDILGWGLIGVPGLKIYVGVLAAIGAGGFFGFRVLRRYGPALSAIMVGLMRTPWLGKTLEDLAMARVAWVLSLTTNTSMSSSRCAETAVQSTGNPVYTNHAKAIGRQVAAGAEIHAAVQDSGAFPRDFVDLLQNAEVSGTLPEAMQRAALDYQQRAEDGLRVLTRITAVLIGVMISLIIGAMILRLALFYAGTIESLSKGF